MAQALSALCATPGIRQFHNWPSDTQRDVMSAIDRWLEDPSLPVIVESALRATSMNPASGDVQRIVRTAAALVAMLSICQCWIKEPSNP